MLEFLPGLIWLIKAPNILSENDNIEPYNLFENYKLASKIPIRSPYMD